jgi:hypothetical protein
LRGQRIGHGANAQGVQLPDGWQVQLVFFLLYRRRRSSVVVAVATNVAVMADAILGHGVDEWPPALEQVLDKPGRTGARGHRSHASSLQLFARVAGRQTQSVEAGPHTLLDMIAPGQQLLAIGRGGPPTLAAWSRTQSGVCLATALCAGGMCSPRVAQ